MEWEDYFKDPSYYLLTRVIPEKYEALGALKMLSPYAMCNQAILSYMPFGLPPVQEALKALIKTGQEVMDFMRFVYERKPSVERKVEEVIIPDEKEAEPEAKAAKPAKKKAKKK